MIVSPVAAAGSDCSSGGGDIVAGTKEIFSYIACVYVVCVSRVGDRVVTTFEGGDKVTIEQDRQEIGDTREKQGRDEGKVKRFAWEAGFCPGIILEPESTETTPVGA